MSNFSDYINSNKSNDCKYTDKNRDTKETLQAKIDEYSNFSQDKLLNEFIKLTIEKKKRGELGEEDLNNLKNTITPMLNNEQKKMLDKMLQMVRDVK